MDDLLADPERELALSYADRSVRPFLRTLWAVDERFGAIVAGTTDPVIGEMRLLWWREALEAASGDVRAEPLVERAAEAIRGTQTDPAEWGAMAEGWHALLQQPIETAELERFARERGGRLFALSAAMLGGDSAAARRAGEGWALTDLAYRTSESGIAERARAMAMERFGEKRDWPRPMRALGVLETMARRDAGSGAASRRQGAPGRVARMAWHRLTGR